MSFLRRRKYFRIISIFILVAFTFQQTSYATPIYKNLATGTSGDEMHLPGEDLETLKGEVDRTGLAIALMKEDPLLSTVSGGGWDTLISYCAGEIGYDNAYMRLTDLHSINPVIATDLLDAATLARQQVAEIAGRPVYYGVYNPRDTGITLVDEDGSPILKDDGKPAVIPSGRTVELGVMYSSEWYPHLSDVRQVFAKALGVKLDGEGRPLGSEETQRNFRVTFGQFVLLHETGHQVWDRILAKYLEVDDKKVNRENREAFSNLFAKAATGFDIDTLPPDEARIRENVKLIAPTLRGPERILLEGLLGDKPILSYDGRGESDLVVALENVGIDTIPHMRDLTFKNESRCQELVAALARAVEAGQLEAMAAPEAGESELAQHLAHFGLGTMTTAEVVSSLKTPTGEVADEPLLRSIGWTPEYVAGIFAREDCATLLGGYDYPEEEAYPVMNKLIAEISRELLIVQGNPKPTAEQIDAFARDTLHAQSVRDIYRLVYQAQRKPEGNLHLSGYGEMELYRMAYRDILELLLENLTIPGVEPEQLRAVLANPLGDSNNDGNDEIRDAVSGMMTADVLTDDVNALRANPERIKDWFRYTVASNDIDYTRASFLKEHEKPDFNLVAYIQKIVDMNFVPELGAEAYIDEFIARYALSGEKRSLVVEADNNVELIFLLKTCEILLSLNPNLTISFVAKPDNRVINDASVADAERTLAVDGEKADDDRIFENLRSYLGNRFILVEGPRSQGTPLDVIPAQLARAIRDADAVFAMGEAHFWCLSGLQKPVYFGLKLKWKPMVQMLMGVDAEKTGNKPPAFFRVDGGPYFSNIAVGGSRSVAPGETPIQVAELCVRDVLTPPITPGATKLAKADDEADKAATAVPQATETVTTGATTGPQTLAQQLWQAVAAEGGMGWKEMAELAQRMSREQGRGELDAALQPLIDHPEDYAGIDLGTMKTKAEELTRGRKLTQGDINVVRLCVGLDWPQGGRFDEYGPTGEYDPWEELHGWADQLPETELDPELKKLREEELQLEAEIRDLDATRVQMGGDPGYPGVNEKEIFAIIDAIARVQESLEEVRRRIRLVNARLTATQVPTPLAQQLIETPVGQELDRLGLGTVVYDLSAMTQPELEALGHELLELSYGSFGLEDLTSMRDGEAGPVVNLRDVGLSLMGKLKNRKAVVQEVAPRLPGSLRNVFGGHFARVRQDRVARIVRQDHHENLSSRIYLDTLNFVHNDTRDLLVQDTNEVMIVDECFPPEAVTPEALAGLRQQMGGSPDLQVVTREEARKAATTAPKKGKKRIIIAPEGCFTIETQENAQCQILIMQYYHVLHLAALIELARALLLDPTVAGREEIIAECFALAMHRPITDDDRRRLNALIILLTLPWVDENRITDIGARIEEHLQFMGEA